MLLRLGCRGFIIQGWPLLGTRVRHGVLMIAYVFDAMCPEYVSNYIFYIWVWINLLHS